MYAEKCPICGSDDTWIRDNVDDVDVIYEYMHCDECGADYVNIYTLFNQTAALGNRD